jgi:Bardet-Biedl syndrome 9 protein
MSLFQARDWWSYRPDGDEECGEGCMIVANIDNDPRGIDKIITGSFQGFLRIFTPKQQGYKVDDLMEFQLDEPILQIEAGRFVGQGSKLSLAVLHPRKLVVYNVVAIGANGKMLSPTAGGAAGESASYYDLNKAYEHKLERTSYNFCYGPFGGVFGKDFMLVQSMDGCWSVLEQESFAFSRFPDPKGFLIPGPICYVPKIDSFVTVNPAMDVLCYKYQVLGSSHGAEKKGLSDEQEEDQAALSGGASGSSSSSSGSSKKIQVDWSLNLGEHIISLFVARYSRSLAASNVDILVLGERTLFTIKENGAIRLQKRLDFNPSTAITYTSSGEAEAPERDVGGANQNLIIASHEKSLMIYKDMQLIWAARTNSVPVAVRVATFA